MKKILILFIFFTVNFTYSQIGTATKVKESITLGVANKMVGLPKLVFVKSDDDKKYFNLSYYNLEYAAIKEIQTISFYATQEELDYLFNFFMSGFDSKDEQSIALGDDSIIITKVSSSIRVFVSHKNDIDGWFYLSKKQTERLFGKR